METHFLITDDTHYTIIPTVHGYERCAPSHSYGPAIRAYWLIHFVESGTGYYRIENKEYTVSAGEMFVIPPYTETYYEADKNDPWSYIWIGFTSEGELPVELAHTINLPEAEAVFREMKLKSAPEGGRNAFLLARIWDLFAILQREYNPAPDYIDRAISIIHSEYMNELTVADIAVRLHLNRSYLSDIFKKCIGMSPKEYLLSYRMNLAATLLKNSNSSICVTAHSVGYTDIYNFSKMFKRHFGVSPSKYKCHRA